MSAGALVRLRQSLDFTTEPLLTSKHFQNRWPASILWYLQYRRFTVYNRYTAKLVLTGYRYRYT